MLNAVRTPSDLRTGATCCLVTQCEGAVCVLVAAEGVGPTDGRAFMAGWKRGANIKPTPTSLTQAATPSGPSSIWTP